MKKILLCTALAAPLLLSGCVISVGDDDGRNYNSSWEQREYNNRKHISKLELDAHYEDVTRSMGVADFNELLRQDGHTYRVLYYRTQRAADDGITTKDECTPLVFEDNRLIGWGEEALRKL
ncbi:DUF3192 domain-containing protein [Alteromonas sp. AMM-1]|uniref:DUF3192 domain-containing protein n=1 Tax=Alteromonas sp. AMM-1 TaxID=3394233 RepID=UPI0039A6E977